MPLVDLSRPLSDGMPGFRTTDDDGEVVEYSARVEPFLTHEASAPLYDGRASFEITEVEFQTAVGTYLDAPRHRYPDGRDVAAIALDELVLPGVAVDVRGHDPGEAVGPDCLPDRDLAGLAVLFDFGWADRWGTEAYRSYPFLARETVDALVDAGVALVGVDTINVDDDADPERPAHTRLLANDAFVVENLRNLDRLHGREDDDESEGEAEGEGGDRPGRPFRLFAAPLAVEGAASMPVRAFAELPDGGR